MSKPHCPRILAVSLVLSGLSLVFVTLTLATLSIARTPGAGPSNLVSLWPLWLASAVSWMSLTMLIHTLAGRAREDTRRFASITCLVIAVAAAARVYVVYGHEPTLSDDIHRYVFDGHNAAAGVNPYVVVPSTRLAASDQGEHERWTGEFAVAAMLNNSEMPTIYLPLSQWAFKVIAVLTPTSAAPTPFARARVMRFAFVGVELLVMVCIALLVAQRRRSAWWLAVYAWHPLALTEIAGAGHQDVLGLGFFLLAWWLATRSPRGVIAWTIPLALATLVKPVVAPLAALHLRGQGVTRWLISLGCGLAVAVVVAGPWLTGGALERLTESAGRFSLKWAHFGAVYEPLLWIIEMLSPAWGNDPQERLARLICVGLLAFTAIFIWRRGRDTDRDAMSILLAMVLLSPTAHPWYLLWALVLVPARHHPAVWIASLTLPWGYAVLADPVEWTVPAWVFAIAYAPIAIAIVAMWRQSPAVTNEYPLPRKGTT